jgi:FtsH-binding integral membrane protein
MADRPQDGDTERERRRQILRRARFFTYGLFLMAVVVAVLGSALVAWLLSTTGVPFLETWIVVTIIVLVAPLIGLLVSRIRGNGQHPGE